MKFKYIVTAMALVVGLANAAQAKTRLIVNCFWPPQHFMCQEILPNWIAEVERVTEGRVTGNIPPKSVAPPPEQLASVEKGIVDVAVQFNGLIGNRVSGPLVAMQPFTGGFNAEIMSKALWDTNRKYFPDEFETVKLLSQWVISPGQLFSMSDTPVNSVEELASIKIWALPGPLAAISKSLGAGVVSSPAVKSNEIISRGIVDAHIGLGMDAIRSFQVIPYTKSMTNFTKAVYTTSFSFFVNQDKWAEISSEDQAAIMSVSGSVLGATAGKKWDTVGVEVFNSFDELGISVIEADPAFEQALVDAAVPVTAKWLASASAAGIDGGAALDFYKARISELTE